MAELSSSYVLTLKCTVCNKNCDTYDDWLNHLVENEHQNFARKACKKWDDKIFGSLSRGRFVTDFVTWEHRSRVAFIQFESRKKAWEVIPKSGAQLKIHNQRIQVKKAMDIMELEWDEFFPSQQPITLKHFKDASVQTKTLPVSNPSKKRKLVCIEIYDQGDSPTLEERSTNHSPCSIKNSSPDQDNSSKNNSKLDKVATNHVPSSQPQLPVPKMDTYNHSLSPLSKVTISNNNIEDNRSNQVPSPQVLSQNDCSNKCIPKNGIKNHMSLSLSSCLLPPCIEKSIHSPTPEIEPPRKAKGAVSNNSIPSKPELSLEKPSRISNNTKRQRVAVAASAVQSVIPTSSSFQIQYKEICGEIMFPDKEYNSIMSMVKSMELCVQETYPQSKLYVFRNLYLKAKNPGSNKLLIFLDTQGIWEEDWILENTVASKNILFMYPDLKKPVEDFWRKLKVKKLSRVESNTQDFIPELNSFGIEFHHEANNLPFTLTTRQHFILEVQTCRLLKYMTAFDPRTISLMTIVKYWAHVNRVLPLLSPESTDKKSLPNVLNKAISLEWMVIVFLSSRGFMPTVRQILERPHKKLIMFQQDIGFNADMTFAKAWAAKRGLPEARSEDFLKSVLSLVQDFFKFCSQLENIPFVMNPRDGEIIKSELFARKLPFCLSAAPSGEVVTKLSEEELKTIKNKNVHVGKPFVSMLHPLRLDQMLAFDESTFYGKSQSLMKLTAEKLQNVTFNGSHDKSYVDLKSLLLASVL